jgi:hypothetical protein
VSAAGERLRRYESLALLGLIAPLDYDKQGDKTRQGKALQGAYGRQLAKAPSTVQWESKRRQRKQWTRRATAAPMRRKCLRCTFPFNRATAAAATTTTATTKTRTCLSKSFRKNCPTRAWRRSCKSSATKPPMCKSGARRDSCTCAWARPARPSRSSRTPVTCRRAIRQNAFALWQPRVLPRYWRRRAGVPRATTTVAARAVTPIGRRPIHASRRRGRWIPFSP